MMRITVEIFPGGDELRPRRMVTMNIGNITHGLTDIADYKVEAVLSPGQIDEKRIEACVNEHERNLGWARLISRAFAFLEPATKRSK